MATPRTVQPVSFVPHTQAVPTDEALTLEQIEHERFTIDPHRIVRHGHRSFSEYVGRDEKPDPAAVAVHPSGAARTDTQSFKDWQAKATLTIDQKTGDVEYVPEVTDDATGDSFEPPSDDLIPDD